MNLFSQVLRPESAIPPPDRKGRAGKMSGNPFRRHLPAPGCSGRVPGPVRSRGFSFSGCWCDAGVGGVSARIPSLSDPAGGCPASTRCPASGRRLWARGCAGTPARLAPAAAAPGRPVPPCSQAVPVGLRRERRRVEAAFAEDGPNARLPSVRSRASQHPTAGSVQCLIMSGSFNARHV